MFAVLQSSRWSTLARGRTLWVAGALAGVLALSGCATPSASGNVYNYQQAQREQVTYMGTVLGVRNITIQQDETGPLGALAGAAIGGVAGSTIGGGSGRTIATVLGGVAGGLAGTQVERNMSRKAGYEITLRMDNGETRVVAQEADIPIRPGQRVQVITGSGATRVVPVN